MISNQAKKTSSCFMRRPVVMLDGPTLTIVHYTGAT